MRLLTPLKLSGWGQRGRRRRRRWREGGSNREGNNECKHGVFFLEDEGGNMDDKPQLGGNELKAGKVRVGSVNKLSVGISEGRRSRTKRICVLQHIIQFNR